MSPHKHIAHYQASQSAQRPTPAFGLVPHPCNVDDSGRKSADASARNCFCVLSGNDKSTDWMRKSARGCEKGTSRVALNARADRVMVGGIGIWPLPPSSSASPNPNPQSQGPSAAAATKWPIMGRNWKDREFYGSLRRNEDQFNDVVGLSKVEMNKEGRCGPNNIPRATIKTTQGVFLVKFI